MTFLQRTSERDRGNGSKIERRCTYKQIISDIRLCDISVSGIEFYGGFVVEFFLETKYFHTL